MSKSYRILKVLLEKSHQILTRSPSSWNSHLHTHPFGSSPLNVLCSYLLLIRMAALQMWNTLTAWAPQYMAEPCTHRMSHVLMESWQRLMCAPSMSCFCSRPRPHTSPSQALPRGDTRHVCTHTCKHMCTCTHTHTYSLHTQCQRGWMLLCDKLYLPISQ